MKKFSVTGMTCGHCVSVITDAISQLQPDACVAADIPKQTVSVNSELTAADIIAALHKAGYPASEVKASCCNAQHSCHS
jgi:copper chaperone